MTISIDVRSWSDTARLLSLQLPLYPDLQPAAFGVTAAQLFPGLPASGAFYQTGLVPAWSYLDDGATALVSINGVTTVGQGLRLYASTAQPFTSVGSWQGNSTVVQAAQQLLALLDQQLAGGRQQYILSGYSYGGSLAEVLAAILLDRRPRPTVQVLTFGSPRPGDASLAQQLTSASVRRVMNIGDPVPRFPPKVWEAPAATFAVGFSTALRWSQYSQPYGGVQLDRQGNWSPAVVPDAVLPITDVQLVEWATGLKGFYAGEHALQTYVARVGLASFAVSSGAPPKSISTGTEQQQPLTLDGFNMLATVGSASPPSTSPTGVLIMGYVPVIYRAKVVKLGQTYQVNFGSNTIAVGTTKSNARNIANHLNGLLRRLLTLKSVDHTQFPAQLSNWIGAASTPGQGFIPTLVVT